LTPSDIRSELEAIEHSQVDKLQLLGLLILDVRATTVSAHIFSFGALEAIEVPRLGTVYAAGSGRDEFIRLLGEADWTAGTGANAFQVARALLGALVNQEYRTGGTIENRWGGGFEAVAFSSDTGRLQKVGDILHTFWTVNLEAPDNAHLAPLFYKTTYWRDALIIRYARFEGSPEGNIQLTMNALELIPPLLSEVKDYDLNEVGTVDFSYKALCCHVLIDRPDGRDIMHIVQPPRQGAMIELEFNGRSGRLHVPGSIAKAIIEEAHASTHYSWMLSRDSRMHERHP